MDMTPGNRMYIRMCTYVSILYWSGDIKTPKAHLLVELNHSGTTASLIELQPTRLKGPLGAHTMIVFLPSSCPLLWPYITPQPVSKVLVPPNSEPSKANFIRFHCCTLLLAHAHAPTSSTESTHMYMGPMLAALLPLNRSGLDHSCSCCK